MQRTLDARPVSSWARTLSLALALAVPAGAVAIPATAQTADAPPSFAPLAQRMLPSVVNISTTHDAPARGGPRRPEIMPDLPEEFRDRFREFFEGPVEPRPPRQMNALGSGFIIDPEGYIVTNAHVVEDATEVRVILHDDAEFPADVIGRDTRTDIALLKIDAGRGLQAVPWGDSDELQVGDWVMAIGNPFGLGGTVTTGILSARARDIQPGPFDDFLQTDASINRGNSGGPMFNMQGEVVGVNTAIFSPTGGSVGIGFAIPSAIAEPVIAELREQGTVSRGWLGVAIQPLTPEIREGLGIDTDQGALVADVTEDSPAAAAGIEVGDVIVALDGEAIEEPIDLSRRVARSDPGQTTTLALLRDGERQEVQVELGLLQDEIALAGEQPDAEEGDEPVIGFQLSPLDDELRQQLGIEEDTQGAVVVGVAPDSPAAQQGFQPGDVILRVGRTRVENPEDVRRVIEQAREAEQDSILVLRQRDGQQLFVPVPLG